MQEGELERLANEHSTGSGDGTGLQEGWDQAFMVLSEGALLQSSAVSLEVLRLHARKHGDGQVALRRGRGYHRASAGLVSCAKTKGCYCG